MACPPRTPYDHAGAGFSGRFAGKQFTIPHPRSGRGPDSYFDTQTRSLALGSRYLDTWILQQRLARVPGKNVSNEPFHCRVGGGASIRQGSDVIDIMTWHTCQHEHFSEERADPL